MNDQLLITLSIVSHGDAEKIPHLLASIQKHEPNASQFQLILTDNLKNNLPNFDPSPWASLHILRNERQLGFAENHNKAFELAQGRYFAILNPDLIFEEPIFDGLITRIQNLKGGLITPQITDENGTVQDSFRTLPTPLELIQRRLPGYKFEPLQPDSEGIIRPDWVAGMFWLMPSDIYQQLGGMDEGYRLYLEDVDFCTRARQSGINIFVDTLAQVRHDARRSSRRNPYYFFLHIQSALRFFTSYVYRQARLKKTDRH